MQNSWGDVNGTAGGTKQQPQKSDTIDSVIDAFNNVVATNSDAILANDWQRFDKKKDGYKSKGGDVTSRSNWKGTISTTSNQDDSENSWSAWDNSNSWDNNDNNSGWGNEGSNGRNYSANEYQNSGIDSHTDDRGYQDVNKVTDTSRSNQVNNAANDKNFSKTQHEYDNQAGEWPITTTVQPQPQHQQQQQPQQSPSPSESDTSTDQNSDTIDPSAIKMAWHSLADPNTKERDDGIGGGQLHRRGRNFIPVPEATVLAIQQKGNNRKIRKSLFTPPKSKNTPIIPQNQTGKPLIKPSQKSATPLKQSFAHNNPYIPPHAAQKASNTKTPVKTPVPQNQKHNTPQIPQQQTPQALQKPSQPSSQPSQPSQPSQAQPTWDSQPSRDPLQQSRPQRPQRSQQPPQSQQPQQPQLSWDAPQLVNEPFWEMPATSSPSPTIQNESLPHLSPSSHTNEVQSQPPRHQSPARSPRPTKPVQDYKLPKLPYIPPEFDSTPYRKQPSPSPVRDTDGYNGPANEDYKDYEQDNDDEYHRNEYYEEESDGEGQENKFNHILDYDDRRQVSEEERAPRIDRGQLLLTINVELSEGKTQPITVHVYDDPDDLANKFCDMWKVTNPMVMPALACLINEEKEKRLATN